MLLKIGHEICCGTGFLNIVVSGLTGWLLFLSRDEISENIWNINIVTNNCSRFLQLSCSIQWHGENYFAIRPLRTWKRFPQRDQKPSVVHTHAGDSGWTKFNGHMWATTDWLGTKVPFSGTTCTLALATSTVQKDENRLARTLPRARAIAGQRFRLELEPNHKRAHYNAYTSLIAFLYQSESWAIFRSF